MKSYVYHSATATAHALIEHLIAMMEREPEKTFYFAFSGGSTPSLMFDIWANEYKEVTPWMRMRIYWVDERCALWKIWNAAENVSERASSGNVFSVYVGRQIDKTSECCG